MTTERTLATIRRVLDDNPAADIRFVKAITTDSHLLSTHGQTHILFVHPEYRELVDELRQVTHPAEPSAGPGGKTGTSEHSKEP